MFVHEKHQHSGLLLVEAQPRRRLLRNHLAHFAVILFPSLPQIVQQDRQVQEILPPDLLIHLPDDARLQGERFGLGHRQQGMFIHRILVILVELHQASERGKDRDELLQQMGAMHRFKRGGHRSGPARIFRKTRLTSGVLNASLDTLSMWL